MKQRTTGNRLGYVILTSIMIIALSVVLSNAAFAGGPKCPCFKAADLEKLMKKEWSVYEIENGETSKSVWLIHPEEWDYKIKSKGEEKYFAWELTGDDEDYCRIWENKAKWKSEYYYDGKEKDKYRPVPAGGPDTAECAAILDNFITSLD